MSQKAEATYHGADIVTRLRAQAPYSDDGQAMAEAAQEIEKLRGQVARTLDDMSALPIGTAVLDFRQEVWVKGAYPGDEDLPFWLAPGEQRPFASHFIPLPATILWQP
ncbi:hypothetical protein [Arthrobacter pityocampae]|uniref:hypothetical protein n=1 Tax=Arthrobacter pityocampae TaxID=547334 RepID=UPI0037350F9F